MQDLFLSPLYRQKMIETIIRAFEDHETLKSRYDRELYLKTWQKQCSVLKIDYDSNKLQELRIRGCRSHKKLDHKHLVEDPIFSFFAINASATLSLFLWALYSKKFNVADSTNQIHSDNSEDYISLDSDDIPF